MSADSSPGSAGEGIGSPRDEAERLVAAGLGAVASALQGMEANRQLRLMAEQVFGAEQLDDLAAGLRGAGPSGAGFATGAADCCVCPVCRVIAALRDPSPEFAEQVASSAGDLAVGLTGLLRALSIALAPDTPAAPAPPRPRSPETSHTMSDPPRSEDGTAVPKPMAKKAVKKPVRADSPDGN